MSIEAFPPIEVAIRLRLPQSNRMICRHWRNDMKAERLQSSSLLGTA
jgi:hypothetical protein